MRRRLAMARSLLLGLTPSPSDLPTLSRRPTHLLSLPSPHHLLGTSLQPAHPLPATSQEPSLLPRLLGFLGHTAPPACSRRAAAVLHNLASAPGNHSAFRPYEAGLLGLAMHPPGECGANLGTVLCEVALELNPTPAW